MARNYTSRTAKKHAALLQRPQEARCFEPTERHPQGLLVGLDVGSTTVKAVVNDPRSGEILWKDYRRHETKQHSMCLDFLRRIREAFPDVPDAAFRVFATGSGSSHIASLIGAAFVQEVNAVALAVERLYPDVGSVVELGGQDAKIIIFKEDPATGVKRKLPTMNDKCAGGTGAVIDKIAAKLGLPLDEVSEMAYEGVRVHPVAGKCGVFAETDINGLQKQGVPPEELMASLFESLVQQNLSVLTRGHTLMPRVVLLGGPNFYLKGLQECWRNSIPAIWAERGHGIPDRPLEELVTVPEDAHYFAALGAVEFGKAEIEDTPDTGVYAGEERLRRYLDVGRREERRLSGGDALVRDASELAAFREEYELGGWEPPALREGGVVEGFLGLDGGSTSTKAVFVGPDRRVLAKAYQLSKGNPIEDTKAVFGELQRQIEQQGRTMKVLGVATTGYAKDILKDVIGADLALVETVAHTQSGLHYFPDADVICDVGGQDIKIVILKDGAVKDFKLNTQCSAGNGYYLQATAESFGYNVTDYADVAFSAEQMPQFGYGCAVFLQSDIVDFQRKGWQPSEILAGLAAVLPKNIWLYVCQVPNLARLGSRFILQGGTQRNLAAVKAQVDFIKDRFESEEIEPAVYVHEHCGEAGAIGCAFEVQRLYEEQELKTSFIGMNAVQSIQYRTTRNEKTRCSFCTNTCMRTFIDVRSGAHAADGVDVDTHPIKIGAEDEHPSRMKHAAARTVERPSGVPMAPGEQRLIIATCEKGTVEDVNDMRAIKKELDAVKRANPNLAAYSAREAFRLVDVDNVADPLPSKLGKFLPGKAGRRALMERRAAIRIGFPRVMNLYGLGPFFMGFFQSLGVGGDRLVWSDLTTDKLYREGSKRGSIDPCFPSKVCISHVHNLLKTKHVKRPLTHIFFPMIDSVPSFVENAMASLACPTAAGTPEAAHAAFLKEGDVFAQAGITFKKTFLSLDRPRLCARQMAADWGAEIGLTEEEAYRAVMEGFSALEAYNGRLRQKAREVLEMLEREDRLGVVLLARPYHNDPGINQDICGDFQKLGYPVLTQDSLPVDASVVDTLFAPDLAAGYVSSARSIEDVWMKSFSENSSRKLWAAKYVARHPNLVALELSNFKCGHDAPIYASIEAIVEQSGTPYFYFKEIDENKPKGAFRIRVETIAYFLRRYHERLLLQKMARSEVEERLAEYERQLRQFAVEKGGSPIAVS